MSGPIGVWVSYYSDGSTLIPHETELHALRAAVAVDGRGDSVAFMRWGETIAQAAKRRAGGRKRQANWASDDDADDTTPAAEA